MNEMSPEERERVKKRFLEEVQSGRPSMVIGSGEGWVKRSSPSSVHECAPPMRDVTYQLPAALLKPGAEGGKWTTPEVDGRFGDLWRCGCGRLWRVGSDCDYGPHPGRRCPRGGYHPDGLRWRPATWWQRLRYRGKP